jgi:hypothetical protein
MPDLSSNGSSELVDWDRVGAVSGLVYAAMSIAGWVLWGLVSGGPPSLSAPASVVSHWYQQHRDITRIGLVPWSLGLGPLLVFLVAFYRRLRAAEGGSGTASKIFLYGAIIGGSIYIGVSFLFFWGAAYRPGAISPELTRFSRDMVMLTGPPLCGTFAVALFAAGAVIRRRNVLSQALGTGAIVCGVLQIFYVFGGFTDNGAFNPQNGIAGALLPYGAHFVWIIAACVLLLSQRRPQPASRTSRPAAQPLAAQPH